MIPCATPASGAWSLWTMSHPSHSAAVAFKMGERPGPEIVRWREEILCEVQALKDELNNGTLGWFQTLPTHGKTAYANRMFPNVPLLRKLGHLIGIPDTDQLMDDLSTGSCLFGKLTPVACWDKKHDWEPSRPSAMTEFSDANLKYIREAFKTRKPDEYAGKMLETLLTEREEGKVSGPYEAPVHWCGVTVPLPPVLRQPPDHVMPIHQLKAGQTAAALAFAIVFEASDGGVKVSRGEDWRRSGHNATTQTLDAPRHHTVDDLSVAARWLHRRWHHDFHIWGHDHQSAYRQLLLDQPQMALLVLFTEFGPTLWMGYGRFSDFIMHLGRLLLLAAVFHYVDDFHGIETASTAWSAFTGFEWLNKFCGCQMKEEKKSPPAAEQILLVVHLDVSTDEARVRPTDSRRSKLRNLSDKNINGGAISNTEAGSLAGEGSFFDSSCMGRVGRAAIKPLLARQHATHTAALSTFRQLSHVVRRCVFQARRHAVPRLGAIKNPENGFGVLFPVHGPPKFFFGCRAKRCLPRAAPSSSFSRRWRRSSLCSFSGGSCRMSTCLSWTIQLPNLP